MQRGIDDRPLLGIGLKVASVMFLMAMSSLVKAASETVPVGEIIFFRSLFAIPVILGWLAWRGDLIEGLSTKDPWGHLWRGLIGVAAMGCIFTGLSLLPLPEVTALSYAAPVLVTVFAALFLGERIRAWRISAVLIGFAGVLVMLSPRLGLFGAAEASGTSGDGLAPETIGALVMLLAAVLMALAMVMVRQLVRHEATGAIACYFSLTCTIAGLATLPFGWVVPTIEVAAMLILAGLLGGAGQILLTESFRHADAAVIAPFEYSSMVFALAIGWFVFAEAPPTATYPGAALVIAAGLIILWREQRVKKPPPAPTSSAGAGAVRGSTG